MIDRIKEKFKKKLEWYEIDKKCGQLNIDSICPLLPTEIDALLKYIEELEEYKWKYEELSK